MKFDKYFRQQSAFWILTGILVLGATVQEGYAQTGIITTVAGNGTAGFSGDGGPATSASLSPANAVAFDSAGNLYIADRSNQRIRKVDTAGIITTVAGNGIQGFSGDNGPATSASLNIPVAVALDTAGNLYITDGEGYRIRKVSTAGIITTVAGTGGGGFSGDGGPATSASLEQPQGVVVDKAGNLYIADNQNFRVRKVDTAGIITTVAGNGIQGFSGDNGPATSASLTSAVGVTLDTSDNLYISDFNGNRVRKVNTAGIITTVAGNGIQGFSGDNGPATSASLNSPAGMAFDSAGNLYIAEANNNRIRKVDTAGTITTVAGIGTAGFSGDNGPATSASLNYPTGVAFDAAGNLYISEFNNYCVRKVAFGPGTGTINVTTNLPAASFMITGPTTYSGGGQTFSQVGAPPGGYTINYGTVTGYLTPVSQSLTLTAGGTLGFAGLYISSASLGTGTISQSGSIAEPVNTATGNYYTSHMDLQVHGKGFALAFTRSYNSLDTYSGPLGVGWTHSYNIVLGQDASGAIVIKDADGHVDVFSPSGGGNFVTQTPGVFDTLRSNADSSFTLTRKNQTRLNFSSAGKLLSIVDRNGNAQTLTYSGANLTAITDTSARVFVLAYDGSGRLLSLSDPLGRTLRYIYDASGNLSSYQDALGGTTQLAYDANHHITSGIDPRGNTYLQNTYDGQGRVVLQLNARGSATTFAYDTPSPGVTRITDPPGNLTQHVHDANLRLVQVIDALGGITSYTYNAVNLRLSATDPLGRLQSFAYDARGNLTAATDATSKITQFAYNATNDLVSIIDQLGRLTQLTYDPKGNLLQITDAAGNTSLFTYTSAGLVSTAKNARTFATGFSYDAAGNLTRVTDALGGTIQLTYDVAGRLLTVKNQLGKTATRTYDANNRLMQIKDPLGNTTQFGYDPNGNLLQITDANGHLTGYVYDATNQLAQVTDAIGGITRYGYDGNTDLISVTDAKSHITIYTYDALRRLAVSTDPLGHQKRYGYDAAGNVTSTLDGKGELNTFGYDLLNRLTSMALADGKFVGYTYDAAGNRLTMTDWHGPTNYAYDVLNRALSVTTPDGKTVGYAYDGVSDRVKLTYPDGKTAQYQYDALNRLIKASDWTGKTTNYTYDAASNLTKLAEPNGASSLYDYDDANRLTGILNLSGFFPLSGFAYVLDKVGNRTAAVSSAGGIDVFGYDGLNRLTSWTEPLGHSTRYSYDAVGNRLSVSSPAGTVNYAYDPADQLLSAGATAFTYDGNGNQLTKTTGATSVTYGWDALNRLISVSGGAANTQYQYDGDGNRIKQQVLAGTYQYLNDTATALPVVLNENGPDGNINYLNGQSLISATSPTFQSFYQVDGLGSVVNVTNAGGNLTANYAYDPWGQAATPVLPPFGLDTLGTKNKYRFTGEAADPSDGLLFLRARYYDPSIGRFLSSDNNPGAMLFPKTINRYIYAVNNPQSFTDHSGDTPEPTGMVLGSSITRRPLLPLVTNAPNSDTTPVSILTPEDLANLPPPAPNQYNGMLPEQIEQGYITLSQSGGLTAICLAAAGVNPAAGGACGTGYVWFAIPRAINSAAPQFGNALGNAWRYAHLPTGYGIDAP